MRGFLMVFALVATGLTHAGEVTQSPQSPFVQVFIGFVAGLQRNPTALSSCQLNLPTISASWDAAWTSIIAFDAWNTLYGLQDFFTVLDKWTQTCNFVVLFNYIGQNITWNLVLTRIITNIGFLQSTWGDLVSNYTAGNYTATGQDAGQLVSKVLNFNLN